MNLRLKLFISALTGCLLLSCGKNGTFPAVPQITFKSISPGQVHYSQIPDGGVGIQIIMSFRSAKNITQDSVYVEQSNSPGFFPYPMPQDIPNQNNLQGNIVFNVFKTRIVTSQNPQGDTVSFRVFVRDPVANKSTDTIRTASIVIFPN